MSFSPSRVKALREALITHGLDAFYLRATSDIAWLTGFEHVFDEEAAHAVLVTPTRLLVHSDSRYATPLRAAAIDTPFVIDQTRCGHVPFAFECIRKEFSTDQDVLRLGIEDVIPLAEYRLCEREIQEHRDRIRLVETNGLIAGLRQVKDEAEITALREAQRITDRTFSHIVGFLRPGMTEKEIRSELDRYMYELGAEGLAFPTIVATGDHAASPHAIPSDRVIREGECVVMDFGARYRGYCSDMTRTVFVGEPSARLRRAWDTLREANESCEALLKAGITGACMQKKAEEILAAGGFADAMGHALGHGVGLDIHEAPNLSPANKNPLISGNVVTVEPGIYVEGEFGMRLEDFGVVGDEGFDVFTKSTHEMVIIEGR